jgi:tetratricopeptide (TPR) repeat protein
MAAAGQDESALDILTAVAQLPGTASAAEHRLKGGLLAKTGKLADCLPEYERAVELEPDQPTNYLLLISVLLTGHDANHARVVIGSAKNLFPQDVRFLVAEGYSYQVDGKSDRAVEIYRDAVKRSPNAVAGRVFLARAYLDSGQVQSAADLLREAVKAAPGSAQAHYQLAIVLANLSSDTAEAVQHLRKAVDLNADYANAHYQLGKLLLQSGDLAGARKHLEAAVRIEPEMLEGHYGLAQVYTRQGLKEQADLQFKLHRELRAKEHWDQADQLLVYDLQ